ncbi:DUF4124 domain-containing protein [Cupriavidus taiwanensis]|uniref:DUF4124 domain-containing protein n=1 Tax=Cupriavidus taiwanensis TaxID=164546 RepID=UPI000E2FA4D7|nr:DUF4124 domain-containing protein [Cupriavidus taiwanensis]
MDASSRTACRTPAMPRFVHQSQRRFPVLVSAAALALTLGAWAGPSLAQSSDVYVCTGPNGVPEYRNGNAGKGCKKLNLPEVVTVPGGRVAAPSRSAGSSAATTGSTSFPRVDSATQRSRDSERRTVLTQELQAEEAKLQALRAEYNNGQPERQGNERNYQKYLDRTAALRDDIARSEANAVSLRRELGNLKD